MCPAASQAALLSNILRKRFSICICIFIRWLCLYAFVFLFRSKITSTITYQKSAQKVGNPPKIILLSWIRWRGDPAIQTFTSAVTLKTFQTHNRDDDIKVNRVQLKKKYFDNMWMLSRQHGRFGKCGNFYFQFYLRKKILSDFWMWMNVCMEGPD